MNLDIGPHGYEPHPYGEGPQPMCFQCLAPRCDPIHLVGNGGAARKVYLAARFSRREEMLEYAFALKADGYSCEPRWLTDPMHRGGDRFDRQFNAGLARHDLEDLRSSDVVIYFTPGGTRGGLHVELGSALAWSKLIYLVGPFESVFTYLPEVHKRDSFADVLLALNERFHGLRKVQP